MRGSTVGEGMFHNLKRGVFALALLVVPALALGQELPNVGQAEYPNDDAVILRWKQVWTLEEDGRQVYEDHRFVKLLNDRSWRRYADPRIDFLDGAESVEILAARAHLPDGSVLNIPAYSFNTVSPRGVFRWPAFSGWRQLVCTFSGVQNEAVLELHYKRTSQPRTRRWLSADLRIGDVDPVVERVVEVNLPSSAKPLHHKLTLAKSNFEQMSEGNQARYRWVFNETAADPDQTACPPWRQRCGRLVFSDCASSAEWAGEILREVDSAGEPSKHLRKFAKKATEGEVGEIGRIRAIAAKFKTTFNFVNDARTWVGRSTRSADEVFDSCYGSPLESAGLLLGLLRSAGIDAHPCVAVDRSLFSKDIANEADLVAVVIEVAALAGPIRLDPASGIINPNGPWRDRDLILEEGGKLRRVSLAMSTAEPDSVRIDGRLEVDEEGKSLSGQLTIELANLFVNPEALRDEASRKKRLESIVSQLMPHLKVTNFSVSQFSPSRMVASVSIESSKPLKDVYGKKMFEISLNSPALAKAQLPINIPARRTAIQLPGVLREDIRLTIELPKGWSPAIVPTAFDSGQQAWGACQLNVEVADGSVQFNRSTRFDTRQIAAEDFSSVRQAVRTLQDHGGRTFLIEKVDR